MVQRISAAFGILTVAIAYLVQGFVFTLLETPWDTMLGSALFDFETQWGSDLASWHQAIFDWVMLFALIALLFFGVIVTRRRTP